MPHSRFDWANRVKAAERDVIRNAEDVRIHRNNLIDRRIEDHARALPFEHCRADLQTYLQKLPER
jgi:hypothetical protein